MSAGALPALSPDGPRGGKSGGDGAPISAAAPRLPPVAGIPLSRHREKLEECAALHEKLNDAAAEIGAERARAGGLRRECESYATEILRLRDVLHSNISELQVNQRRVGELERENAKLREELRAHGGAAAAAADLSGPARLQFYRSEIRAPHPPAPHFSGTGVTTAACASPVGPLSNAQPSMGSGSSLLNTQQRQGVQGLLDVPLHTDVHNVSGAMSAYVSECFNAGVSPHIELLHSLHDGGSLVAVEPPVTFAQLSAMERVLCRELNGISASPAGGRAERALSLCRAGRTASVSSFGGAVGSASWAAGIHMISFRCDNWSTDAMPILSMLRALPEVRRVELIALGDTAVMRQFAEVLLMLPNVEDISLPELALCEDGLMELGALLSRRGHIAGTGDAVHSAPWGQADGAIHCRDDYIQHTKEEEDKEEDDDMEKKKEEAYVRTSSLMVESAGHTLVERQEPIELRCVDLSRCIIVNPIDFGRLLCCTSVEVLILTECRALRDAQVREIVAACPRLHTLDLSGCVNLTTACIAPLNTHESLRILRLENCPRIQRIELDRVVVLFSSLVHVTTLRAPELRRLPVPIAHAQVLFDIHAPKLSEFTLKGIVIDRGTLRAFTFEESKDSEEAKLDIGSLITSSVPMSAPPSVSAHSPAQHLQEDSPHIHETESLHSDKNQTQEFEDVVVSEFGENLTRPATTSFTSSHLASVGFVDCVIACTEELETFVHQQSNLLRLSLHGSKGVTDSVLLRLPATLLELDLGGVAQLTGISVDALVTRTPQLTRLSLKNAGPRLTSSSIRRLHALVDLETLNLLAMPQLESEVISAIAMALPRLRLLYHETAMVGDSASPVFASPVLRVERRDEEDAMRRDVQDCARELLQLRDETALALWMESRLPRAARLLPATPAGAKGLVELGAPQPPLTAHTSYYEAAARTLSSRGRVKTAVETAGGESTRAGAKEEEREKSDARGSGEDVCRGDAWERGRNEIEEEDDEDEEEHQAMKIARRAEVERRENALGEQGRLAVEKAPLGPWGAADIVAEHRRQLSVKDTPN